MTDHFPQPTVAAGHVEPAPRRVRGVVDGVIIFDTVAAHYVWEWPFYPQYYIPVADCVAETLVDGGPERRLRFGTSARHSLCVGDEVRDGVAQVYGTDAPDGIAGAVRFDWAALDHWYEEDEEIFVHPRNPYVRVDALRSTRTVRIELGGTVLAESSSPVLVFETGLPTRYYLNPTEIRTEHLRPSDTETACPYKGVTSRYWSVLVDGAVHEDLAWSYDFPTRQLLPIAGLVAFYNEKVDVFVDGELQPQPSTHLVK